MVFWIGFFHFAVVWVTWFFTKRWAPTIIATGVSLLIAVFTGKDKYLGLDLIAIVIALILVYKDWRLKK